MELFEYVWFNDFHGEIENLKTNFAMEEDWDYHIKPLGKNPILENYIKHTFVRLYEEGKVLEQNGYSLFNTGLATTYQEEIYALSQVNKKPGTTIPWFFIGWRKASDRDLSKFSKLPENANYFKKPSDLIYDSSIDLRPNLNHIIEDNIGRFPKSLQSLDSNILSSLLSGAIEDSKRRVKRNYKTAIPQYYKGNLQLLLPLCLTSKNKADLALVVDKDNGVYRASTCLTLDMAINNARLIAKPDDEWLII